jgi:hypothetical protein
MSSYINLNALHTPFINDAWLRTLSFSAHDERLHQRIKDAYAVRRGWTQAQVDNFVQNLPQNEFPSLNHPNITTPIPQPPFPNPTANNRQHHIANTEQDIETIRLLSENDELYVSMQTTPNGPLWFIKIPQVTNNPADYNYHEAILQILLTFYHHESLFPFLIYESLIKARDGVRPMNVLQRGLFCYHGTVSPVDRNNNGVIEWNPIIEQCLARCGIIPNYDDVNIDHPHPGRNQFFAQGQVLSRPLVGQDLLSPRYRNANIHRETGRAHHEYVARIGQDNYDAYYRPHALNFGWSDGGVGHFNHLLNQNVIVPGNLHQTSSFIVNGSHYNNHVGPLRWQQARAANANNLQQRANEYHHQAETFIRPNLQNPYRDEDCGDKSYATTTLFDVFLWYLTSGKHWRLNFPNAGEEFSKSMLLQILLHSDLRNVFADSVMEEVYNLVRWRFPIPIVASFHVELGHPPRPLLGSVFTVNEECYRPINQPRWRKFRIVH